MDVLNDFVCMEMVFKLVLFCRHFLLLSLHDQTDEKVTIKTSFLIRTVAVHLKDLSRISNKIMFIFHIEKTPVLTDLKPIYVKIEMRMVLQ